MQFGIAKTTVVNQLGNAALFLQSARGVAEHIRADICTDFSRP